MKKKFALVIAVVFLLTIFTTVLVACNNGTVTFDSNGGSKIESVKKTVEEEPIPDKEGYDFAGWFTNKDLKGERVEFPYSTEKNVTLYAKWDEAALDVSAVVDDILKVLATQMKYDSSKKNIAWDFELDAFQATAGATTTYRLSTKANISADNANDAAIGFALQEVKADEVKNILSIVVDNGYIYLDTLNTDGSKFMRKFNGFELGEILKVKHIGDPKSVIDMVFGMVVGLLFQEAEMTGDVVELTGNVDELLESLPGLLGALIPDVDIQGILDATGIVSALNGTEFKLKANLKSFAGVEITAVKEGSFDAGIKLNKATFDSTDTALEVPVNSEVADLDAINLLNFTLEGQFSLVASDNNYKETKTTFDYEMRMDIDPFNIMEIQSDGSVKVNAMNIFDNGLFWFDVFHDCSKHGGYQNNAFCNSRASANLLEVEDPNMQVISYPYGAKGSIFTLAMDSREFGNNNLNISLNLNYILPNGFFETILGEEMGPMLGMLIGGFTTEYLTLTLNPEALIETFIPSQSAASINETADINLIGILGSIIDFVGNIDMSKNYIGLISNIFDMVKTIKIDDNGLNIGNIDKLYDIINDFTDIEIGGNKLAKILRDVFTEDVDKFELSVDNLAFADTYNANFPTATRFAFTNDYDGKQKFIPLSAYFDFDWINEKGVDGKEHLKITKEDSDGNPIIATHDGDKVLPISNVEMEQMLDGGTLYYNGTKLDGDKGSGSAKIIKVLQGPERDADGNIKAGEHRVKLMTAYADGGVIDHMLRILSVFDLGIPIPTIPGHIVEGTVYVCETNGGVKFSQADGYNNFVPDKKYTYNEQVNVLYNAQIEFLYKQEGSNDNYTKNLSNIKPTFKGYDSMDFSSAIGGNNPSNTTLKIAGDATLEYAAFGVKHSIDIKMPESYMTKVNNNTDAVIYKGKETVAIPIQLKTNENYSFATGGNKNTVRYFNEATDTYEDIDIAIQTGLIYEPMDNMTAVNNNTISFTKAGRYNVKGFIKGAPFEIVFEVSESAIAAPQYTAKVYPLNSDGYVQVDVMRNNNVFDGEGVEVELGVSVNGTLLTAEQYETFVIKNGEYVKVDIVMLNKHISPFKPQQIFVKVSDGIENFDKFTPVDVTLNTVDPIYGGAEVGNGSYNGFGFKINIGDMRQGQLILKLESQYNYDEEITVLITSGGVIVNDLAWYNAIMNIDGTISSTYRMENYVPKFYLAKDYEEVDYFTKTTILPICVSWDGLKAGSKYTITVTDASGRTLVTYTNEG